MLDGNNDAPLKKIVRHCSKSQTKKEQRKMLLSSVFLGKRNKNRKDMQILSKVEMKLVCF